MSIAVGTRAPGFELPTVGGGTATAQAPPDGLAVVAFWCNHCPYVQAWEGRFDAVAREYAAHVRVVAVNANDPVSHPADDFDAMTARAADRGYAFAYAHDRTQETARAYGATRTPEVFVLDADGVVRYHGAIDDSHDPDGVRLTYLRDALDALLAGRDPEVAETAPVGCTIKWAR
jgi:thiol-disulfide isomerase/thioredoxin